VEAIRACKDINGVQRSAGEQWLIRELGFYIPKIDEEFIEMVKGRVITDKQAIMIKAKQGFTDIYNIKRSAGEEWIVTRDLASLHIIDVHEQFLSQQSIVVLRDDQFCYI
jgi:major vault protein